MEKILITGANGFFASRFIQYYKDKYDILPIRRNDLDINNEKSVIDVIKKYNPQYVIHTAAIADTGVCENNPELSLKVNVDATINIAKACSINKSKLIYLSSEQVYNGNVESGPYDENIVPLPNTVYGKHKLQAEKEISKILNEAWILRLTWLFGFPERNRKVNANIIWNILKAAIRNEKIKIPVHEFRGMTYVYDLIGNFDKIFEIPYGIYNTGSENDLNTYEIAQIVLKEMGIKNRAKELLIKDVERYKDLHRDLRISNDKFKKQGIYFKETKDAITQCINESNFSLI